MDLYSFTSNEKVLLLGEGNFSFSVSLLQIHLNRGIQFNNFYSTCYESEITCSETLSNIKLIKEHGINVKLGVDATQLSQHSDLASLKFDKIIFNFPHIKGKMKINLNRDLIKGFFISSKWLIEENGVVIVALCSGQGGTDFDRGREVRKWENTWQVVEMGAHGDFILSKVEMFPNEIFPEYISSGFRGKSKSFNTCDAVVHQFIRTSPPIHSIDDTALHNYLTFHHLPPYNNIKTPFIYSKILNKNPFTNDSPQHFFKKLIISCSESISNTIVSDNLAMTVDYDDNFHVKCKIGQNNGFLRNSLIEVLPTLSSENNYIFSGFNFFNVSSDFSKCPVKCEAIIIGKQSQTICSNLCDKLQNIFSSIHLEWLSDEINFKKVLKCNYRGEKRDLIVSNDFQQNKDRFNIFVIDLDEICMCVFNIESWKQLWSDKSCFKSEPKLIFTAPSLSMQTYNFDINFITNPKFNMDSFVNLLWQIGDNMVCAVLLLNSYQHCNSQNLSHCYRIVYKSYEKPLYRKRIVNFHENVIGKSLQILYNVVIS